MIKKDRFLLRKSNNVSYIKGRTKKKNWFNFFNSQKAFDIFRNFWDRDPPNCVINVMFCRRINVEECWGKKVVRYVTQEKFKTMGFYDTEHVIIVFIVSFECYVSQGLNCVKKLNENVRLFLIQLFFCALFVNRKKITIVVLDQKTF